MTYSIAPTPARTGYVGWVEFLRDTVSTTHIAYLHEDGSIYFPEGPTVVSEIDIRLAEVAGSMWPLVRADWLTLDALDVAGYDVVGRVCVERVDETVKPCKWCPHARHRGLCLVLDRPETSRARCSCTGHDDLT